MIYFLLELKKSGYLAIDQHTSLIYKCSKYYTFNVNTMTLEQISLTTVRELLK